MSKSDRDSYVWHCPSCRTAGLVEFRPDELAHALAWAGTVHHRLAPRCAGRPQIHIPIEIAPEEWVGAA